MLRSAKDLNGYGILAIDGPIGHIADCYFDEDEWTVRYFVVDTGKWLPGRRVLIAPESVGEPDWKAHSIPVSLTRDQVKNSPDADLQQPVSKQFEEETRRYYGYPPYWSTGGGWAPVPPPPRPAPDDRPVRMDSRLRSTSEVAGYRVGGTDGDIGHIADFLVDDDGWAIRYLVIDTSTWWAGKRVLIAPRWVRAVRWSDSRVETAILRQAVKRAPEYEPVRPITREWENDLHRRYGQTGYWESGERPRLVSLSEMRNYEVAENSPDPRQHELVAADRRPAGVVDDLIVDAGTMKARYLVVRLEERLAGDSGRRVLVPAEHAHLTRDGRQIVADVGSPEELVAAPPYSGAPVSDEAGEQFERIVGERRVVEAMRPWPARCVADMALRRR